MDSSFQWQKPRQKKKVTRRFNPCFNGFFFSINLQEMKISVYECFNPCFNGFFFSIKNFEPLREGEDCFNPCFNGFFFSMELDLTRRLPWNVSILVLMDSSFQLVKVSAL